MYKRVTILFLSVVISLSALSCNRLSKGNEERGDMYFGAGQYDDSLAEYMMAARNDSMTASLLRKIGKVYVAKGDFVKAKSYYDKYFEQQQAEPDPSALLDYFNIAVKRGEDGDRTTMVNAFEEILKIDPQYSLGKYFFDLAEYYYEHAQYDKSIPFFLRALPLDVEVDNRNLHLYHLAESYEKTGDVYNACLYYEEYLLMYPETELAEQARWHQASCAYPLAERVYREDKDYEAALDYLAVLIDFEQPQHLLDDAYYLKGDILVEMNRLEEAKRAYRQVLRLNKFYYTEKIAESARQKIHDIDLKRRFGN